MRGRFRFPAPDPVLSDGHHLAAPEVVILMVRECPAARIMSPDMGGCEPIVFANHGTAASPEDDLLRLDAA